MVLLQTEKGEDEYSKDGYKKQKFRDSKRIDARQTIDHLIKPISVE